ncbi:hypothetical protein BJF95_06475 [Rhizobium oryziradicis]|uniref:Uncharacterized protein n=2 Tax=Rhizobium oryziradicis TaxID=1867956 RepID=A0A1Q8ZQM1_9HYPH|nr:hypothetical protein BJF95_06475 [Rhizobium oryziradicis]
MMKEKSKMVQKLDSSAIDTQALEQDLRAQSSALCAKLVSAHGQDNDDALRQNIATIAAGMLVLTASRAGATSPIPALLANQDVKSNLIDAVQAYGTNPEIGT